MNLSSAPPAQVVAKNGGRGHVSCVKNGRQVTFRATSIVMPNKPAFAADDPRESDDQTSPSASARFRLKMTPDGQLIPVIVPVDGQPAQPNQR